MGKIRNRPDMSVFITLALACLLFGTSCRPPTGSKFAASFDPGVTLNQLALPDGITYSNPGSDTASFSTVFGSFSLEKHWQFTFQGSHAQLDKQLDQFRAEVERQIKADGCTISGRAQQTGATSEFSFDYAEDRVKGSIRVTSASLQSGSQSLDVTISEH